MSSFRDKPIQEQIATLEQTLLFWEDKANSTLASAEKDERVGRRARYYYRDCVSRVFLVCWDVLGYCKQQAANPEGPAEDAMWPLTMAVMELHVIPQLLSIMVDKLLDGEGPAPKREEGWPFGLKKVEEGTAAPPAKPEGPG